MPSISVLCALLTRDLLAIAKFLFYHDYLRTVFVITKLYTSYVVISVTGQIRSRIKCQLNTLSRSTCKFRNIFGFSNFTRQCSNILHVKWKSLQCVHIEFSYESTGERILKIGPHLLKLLSNIKQLTFSGDTVYKLAGHTRILNTLLCRPIMPTLYGVV